MPEEKWAREREEMGDPLYKRIRPLSPFLQERRFHRHDFDSDWHEETPAAWDSSNSIFFRGEDLNS